MLPRMTSVEERPPQKRRGMGWLVTGLVVWVVILFLGIIAVFSGGGGAGDAAFIGDWSEAEFREFGDGDNKIAMIEVSGEIMAGRTSDSLFGPGAMGADDWVSQVEQAREDDSVEGVIIRLNTPGGAVVASDQVYEAVRELARAKPVVALMEDTAASGGYYIAAAANHIVANRATLTGSIGVIAMFPNLEGTADKLGVETVVIKSGELKDIGSPFREMTRRERRLLQRLIDQAYEQFVDAVSNGRKMEADAVRRLADGRVYSGEQARDARLVDQLGGLKEAVEFIRSRAKLEGGERVVLYAPRPLSLADALFGARVDLGRQVREAVVGAGRDLAGQPRGAGLHYLWLG